MSLPTHGFLSRYLNNFRSQKQTQLAESLLATASEFSNNYIENFDYVSHKQGLLFGYVQSGKTAQMIALLCSAADNDFSVFLVLTSDINALYDQTLSRIRNELPQFCICSEKDEILFEQNNLVNKTIIVLKKNHSVLKNWANILVNSQQMQGNPIFIIDDEADAGSLNTEANKNSGQRSTINNYIYTIKTHTPASFYLQVTGTPQSLFLQDRDSGFKPEFSYYFKPSKGYIGGNYFFPENLSDPEKIPAGIYLLNDKDKTHDFDYFLIRHLMISALSFIDNRSVSNALIHPSSSTSVHEKWKTITKQRLEFFKDNPEYFEILAQKTFLELDNQRIKLSPFKATYAKTQELLKNEIKILVFNSKNQISGNEHLCGCNIIIGGNSLGRGITFPALNTFYYSRNTRISYADTLWQHNRIFGYDRDPGLVKIFISPLLYKRFRDINATNNAIIRQVEGRDPIVQLHYSKGIKPTRSNVLNPDNISILSGGTNYFPMDPENKDISKLDEMLSIYDEKECYHRTSIDFGINILNEIESRGGDFDMEEFLKSLQVLKEKKPDLPLILLVRRNRDLTKGTGAMLSPDDLATGKQFSAEPVLTLYKVTGTKGWGNRKLWIPNIKLPDNVVYMSTR